ncbi:OmpA family protein [Fluviicola sp.]|uniref:OmpA family protein n=1 Tax=Fluviicola sp. TaxID=1917219 RepID=UPI002623F5DB|nr:OmpA family protein [Fluviicola sp.]
MKLNLLSICFILSCSSCFAQDEVRKDSLSVLFAYNQSEVFHTDQFLEQLKKVDVSSLSVIRLVGYTDSSGSVSRNNHLAADRIKAVEDLLKNTALSRVKIETVNANETSGFRVVPDEENRRVDILFYGKKEVPKLAFELNKPLNLNINFIGGSAEFLSGSYTNLVKLRNLMVEDTTLLLKLHGHVCCADDMELSKKRAFAVMNYLSQNDVDYKRMSAEGFSNSRRLVPDDSETNMSLNRRVEAIFYRKE